MTELSENQPQNLMQKKSPAPEQPAKTGTNKHWRLFLLWVVFILLDTLAQIIFKIGAKGLESTDGLLQFATVAVQSGWVWLAVICYIMVFFLWMLILQKMELSQAFPLTGLTYITVPFCAYMLFSETIDWTRGIGIAVILIGVTLLGSES